MVKFTNILSGGFRVKLFSPFSSPKNFGKLPVLQTIYNGSDRVAKNHLV